MRKNQFILTTVIFSFFLNMGMAKDTLFLKDYLEIIDQHHPLIKKAKLFDEVTDAYDLKGKGALDPKISSDYQTKYFDNTDYFTVWQGEAKIPTALPIDFSLGYENNDGVFLNDENSVPSNGLVYGTLNLSLLRGLIFDEQRFQIQRARLHMIKSQIEKDILLREVVFQGVTAYLEWAVAQAGVQLRKDYLDLINERHQNVVELFVNGAQPAIDTVESKLNINSAEKLYYEAVNKLLIKQQKANLFIWNSEGQPLEMQSHIIPDNIENTLSHLSEFVGLIERRFYNDPYVEKLQNEMAVLELENRLEKEQLKPRLDLKYNTILNLGKDEFDPTLSLNDYKYGVSFEYPILNRKSRGELKLNDALMEQMEIETNLYEQKLLNAYDGLLLRRDIQNRALAIVSEKIINSEMLYDVERIKFNIGESSVFLLNSRERKLLEARVDQIKTFDHLGKIINEMLYLKLGQS